MRKINYKTTAFRIAALMLIQTALLQVAAAQSGRRVRSPEAKEFPTDMSNSWKVKYEGGMVGEGKTSSGTLVLDGTNKRLLFMDKKGNHSFSVPYATVIAAYPDERKKTPFLVSMASDSIPYGAGIPSMLIKTKARYLIVHYKEIETDLQGVVTFKFKDKKGIEPSLEAVVRDTGLTRRGNIFVKMKRAKL